MSISAIYSSKLKTIIFAGITAGTLDILAAFINTSLKQGKFAAEIVLRFIASGIFGKPAFSGGGEMIAAGLIFHYIIATGFAAAYFIIYNRFLLLKKNYLISGTVYGIIVWIVMNLIIVPISNTPHIPFSFERISVGIIILIICIGWPISFFAERHNSKN